jgi:hypothetical protein
MGERRQTARLLPVVEQFLLVNCRPFDHQSQNPGRQRSFQYGQTRNSNNCLLIAVPDVKMRGCVVVVKHGNHNSEKPTDFRHWTLFSLACRAKSRPRQHPSSQQVQGVLRGEGSDALAVSEELAADRLRAGGIRQADVDRADG